MKTIREVLQEKGGTVYTIGTEETVFSALQFMGEKHLGALLVLNGGQVAGIVSERDYARKVVLLGLSSLNTPVREIMTDAPIVAQAGQNIVEGLALMTERRIRHLPVMDGNKLVGLVSIGDLVKAALEEKGFLLEHAGALQQRQASF